MTSGPEYNVSTILRPYNGFETMYQGQDCRRMIIFCDNNQLIDPSSLAGKRGFDPRLVAGVPTKVGQEINLYIPIMRWRHFDDSPSDVSTGRMPYNICVLWRLRTLGDSRERGGDWHIAKETFGAASTAPDYPGDRYLIICCTGSSTYAGPQPVPLISNVSSESVVTETKSKTSVYPNIINSWWDDSDHDLQFNGNRGPYLPLVPDLTTPGSTQIGVLTQGMYDPGLVEHDSFYPIYLHTSFVSQGDEMIVGIYRESDTDPEWDFQVGGSDHEMSIVFSFPHIAMHMLRGIK